MTQGNVYRFEQVATVFYIGMGRFRGWNTFLLEQLLIDLAWHSSRLEGNRKSLLDTKALFERGRSAGDDEDALMCKTACKTFQISGVISVQKLPPWVV